MQKVFLTDRYPGWYAQMDADGHSYTFGPYSEAECDAVLKKDDLEAIWAEVEQVRCVVIVKQEGKEGMCEALGCEKYGTRQVKGHWYCSLHGWGDRGIRTIEETPPIQPNDPIFYPRGEV